MSGRLLALRLQLHTKTSRTHVDSVTASRIMDCVPLSTTTRWASHRHKTDGINAARLKSMQDSYGLQPARRDGQQPNRFAADAAAAHKEPKVGGLRRDKSPS